jgi:hypothetical protein
MQKWSTHYKGSGPTGIVTHFESPLAGDTALCGASLSGDDELYEKAPWRVTQGYGKVNCEHCKAVVAAVRKIKGNEIE